VPNRVKAKAAYMRLASMPHNNKIHAQEKLDMYVKNQDSVKILASFIAQITVC